MGLYIDEKINRIEIVAMREDNFEAEHSEMLNGIRKIKKQHGYTKVRIILNDDGSGEIQGFNPKKGLAFSKVKSFKNFDELLAILNQYFFVK